MSQNKIALTIDVEDGVSIAMRDVFSKTVAQTERVVTYTTKILELCEKHNIKATFFVLGEVAEKFPDLIKRIAKEGHELGVHGYHHLQFFRMTKEVAFQELSSAKKLIEDLSGQVVSGHRAPAFSITPETEWGLDVIAEAGFRYDSSIMPIKGNRYGWPGFNKSIQEIKTPNGSTLIEAPLTTINLWGKDIPIGGGGYLRLFPFSFTKMSIDKVLHDRPVIVYLHPYELDFTRYPDYYFEELRKSSFQKRFKMKSNWWNRKTIYPKLENLMTKYKIDTLGNIIENL